MNMFREPEAQDSGVQVPINPRQSCIQPVNAAVLSRIPEGFLPPLQCWKLEDSDPLSKSSHVNAPYHLLRLVHSSDTAEYWDGRQRALSRPVTICRPRSDRKATEDELLWREHCFRTEALVTALLEHPNTMPAHDFGVDEFGRPLLVLKQTSCVPWHHLLEQDIRKLPPEQFLYRHLKILAQVTQAVAFAHSRGIVHRDIKPANVLVGEFGEVLLTNWAAAIQLDQPSDGTARRETAAAPILPNAQTATNPSGTPALMAPEQTLDHARDIGPWTDVYLLGGTLHFLLTNRYPHDAESSAESLLHARSGVLKHLHHGHEDRPIPEALKSLVMGALQALPKDRTPSAMEFLTLLEDYLCGATDRHRSRELMEQAGEALRQIPQQPVERQGESRKQVHHAPQDSVALSDHASSQDILLMPRGSGLNRMIEAKLSEQHAKLRRMQIITMVLTVAVVVVLLALAAWGGFRFGVRSQDTVATAPLAQ